MKYKKLLGAASAMLTFAIVVTLLLPPGALAQSKYKTLYKFKGGKDGSGLLASVIFDQAGNLYGMTFGGGDDGAGTIFELSPNQDGSWTKSRLYSFTGGKDGGLPFAGLIFDSAGNLYGTTYYGGDDGVGAIFELSPNQDGSWTEKVLHSFTGGKDGALPAATLIFDQAGNLYGTAEVGADLKPCRTTTVPGCGVVFELTPN
jgi:uncharacterized repeat protein (TIGR03803 family)